MLVAVREVRAGDAGRRSLSREVVLDSHLALLGAEAASDPVQLCVAADARVVRREMPGLAREVLERDVLELRTVLDEELDRGIRLRAQVGRGRDHLLHEREAGPGIGRASCRERV